MKNSDDWSIKVGTLYNHHIDNLSFEPWRYFISSTPHIFLIFMERIILLTLCQRELRCKAAMKTQKSQKLIYFFKRPPKWILYFFKICKTLNKKYLYNVIMCWVKKRLQNIQCACYHILVGMESIFSQRWTLSPLTGKDSEGYWLEEELRRLTFTVQ